MTNQEKIDKYMNRNIKLCPAFLGISYDVIFIWTISTMYFTTQKGLTMSQTIMLDSVLMLAGCLLCVPIERLFRNIKPLKASIIGNLGYVVFILLCLFGTQYVTFIIAQIFLAFGYVVASIKNNKLLTESLSLVKRDKEFNKISGQGLAVHYITEAVGAIVVTYVYDWRPEMVFVMSLCMVVLVEIIGFCMKEPAKFQESNFVVDAKAKDESKKEQKVDASKQPDSYAKILMSSFFIMMLVYMFFYRGANAVVGSGFKMYLQEAVELNAVPMWLYGYIYAAFRAMGAISSKYQFKFDLKFGVRSLIIFNTMLILGFLISGIVYLFTPFSIVGLVLIIICNYVLSALRAPNQIFVNNYMQVCVAPKNIEKTYSIRTIVEYLGYAVWNFIYSMLVGVFNDSYGLTSITFVALFSVPIIVSLILFIRALVKKHAQKYTIIKDEYVND